MTKFVAVDLESGFNTVDSLNANFAEIERLSDTWLTRDAQAPNDMESDLDMAFNRLINLPAAISSTEPATLGQVIQIIGEAIAEGGGSIPGLDFTYETIVLVSGQTYVKFNSDITFSSYSISGPGADGRQLILDTDFTQDIPDLSITLTDSYPAGTVLQRKLETVNP